MKKSIWENINYITNSSVSLDGFVLMQHEYFKVYDEYMSLLPEKMPSSSEEASFLEFELSKPADKLIIYQTILEILACTSLESLINSAGIHVMSERFFKRTVERNDIVTKIQVLVFSINGEEVSEKKEELIKIKNLFERRNKLVHPKSKKLDWNNLDELEKYAINSLDIRKEPIIQLLKDFDSILEFLLKYELIPIHVLNLYKERRYV